jgi:putative nucleotidyltransferase with HDIG domain
MADNSPKQQTERNSRRRKRRIHTVLPQAGRSPAPAGGARRESAMNEAQVLQKLDQIRDVPTLPTIVYELNKLLQDPDTSIAKISQTIEKDQAMALKILKLVNSAFYGFKTKISDIRNAVVMLGFNAVRNAIISLSVIGAFPKKTSLRDFNIADFWKHSLAVAVTSKNLSLKTRSNSPDNCFVGGLLHDVGKVIMAQYFLELFSSAWSTMQNDITSFYEAECKCLSTSHPVIGAHLTQKWQLPQGLVDAIRWHHEYQTEAQNVEFMRIIYLANIIVNSYNDDPECLIDLSSLHPDARKFMMTAMDSIGDWYSGIIAEIEQAYAFFLED